MKSQDVNFQKLQKLLASLAWSSEAWRQKQPAIEIEWIAIECSE